MAVLVVREFVRKPSYVMAVRVTEANMEDVAEWCGGVVRGSEEHRYIKVGAHKPMNAYQTKASVGNWVLKQDGPIKGKGKDAKPEAQWKVYTDHAFITSFNAAFDDEKKLEAAGTPIGDQVFREVVMSPRQEGKQLVRYDKVLEDFSRGLINPPSNPETQLLGLHRPDAIDLAGQAALRPRPGFAVGPNTGVFERYQREGLNQVTNRPAEPPVFQNLPEFPVNAAHQMSTEELRVYEDLPASPGAGWVAGGPGVDLFENRAQRSADFVILNQAVENGSLAAARAQEISELAPKVRTKWIEEFITSQIQFSEDMERIQKNELEVPLETTTPGNLDVETGKFVE